MTQLPGEQFDSRQRSALLIAALFTVALFALSQGMTLAFLNRVKEQVEDTNRRVQELEKKLDELNGRRRP